MALEIAQTTPTANAIAAIVASAYSRGSVVHAEFLRRSFNQVYGLRFANGERVIARLASERPRGLPNLEYEAALLDHLHAQGLQVSRCLRTASGAVSIPVALPEGDRALALFEHLDGSFTGPEPEEAMAFGEGLARLHEAAASFRGPESYYRHDLSHLIDAPLKGLLKAPTMTDELRERYAELAARLRAKIGSIEGLTEVACHGDAHGSNNFITRDTHGKLSVSFFDFDDAAPGYLAYELAVYPWALHPRSYEQDMPASALTRWRSQLDGYAKVRTISDVDLQAIPLFIAVRQLWICGEYAGRVPVWGSQAMPSSYLQKQLKLFDRLASLSVP